MNLVVSLSEDGESWTTVDAVHSENRGKNGNETVTLGGELDDAYKARYVRFSFVVDNGQWNVTDHYVSVYMSEIEVFGTKSAESAKPAEDCGQRVRPLRLARPSRRRAQSAVCRRGQSRTDAFTYDNAMDIFAVRDESGKVTGLLMDAVCMAKATRSASRRSPSRAMSSILKSFSTRKRTSAPSKRRAARLTRLSASPTSCRYI